MNAPEPADSASNSGRESPHTHRRFWRWGIWFWVVAWVVSILVIQCLVVNLKGCWGTRFYFGGGSVGVNLNTFGTAVGNHIRWEETHFIWAKQIMAHLRQYPEDSFGFLGHVAWSEYAYDYQLAFPIAGFLWLWLIGAWTDGFRKLRWPESFKDKRAMMRIATLVSLPLLIVFSNHRARVAGQSAECTLMVRNIQQAVRGYLGMRNPPQDEPMPWHEIFGPKKSVSPDGKKCPSGQPYRLTPYPPRMGELAAQCQNPEHQRRMKKIDTSGW